MGEHAAVNRSVDSSSLPGAAKSTKSELFILRWIVRILPYFDGKIPYMIAEIERRRDKLSRLPFYVADYFFVSAVFLASRFRFHSSKSLRPSSVAR